MSVWTFVVLLLFLAVVQAKYEFTKTAKDCVEKINSDEDSIRAVVTETDPLPENNELVQRFFECILGSYINDSNALKVDDKLKSYVANIFAVRMGGKRKLAELVAEDCLDFCSGLRGPSKGQTAVSVMNCLKVRFEGYNNE